MKTRWGLTLWQAHCKPFFTCVNSFSPQTIPWERYYYPPHFAYGKSSNLCKFTKEAQGLVGGWWARRPAPKPWLRSAVPGGPTLKPRYSGLHSVLFGVSYVPDSVLLLGEYLGPCSNRAYILIRRERKYTSKQTRDVQQVLSPMKKKLKNRLEGN